MKLKESLTKLSKGEVFDSDPYSGLSSDEQREVERIEKELCQKAQSKKFYHTTGLKVHYHMSKNVEKIASYFAKQGLFCAYGLAKESRSIKEYDLMFAWHEKGTSYKLGSATFTLEPKTNVTSSQSKNTSTEIGSKTIIDSSG